MHKGQASIFIIIGIILISILALFFLSRNIEISPVGKGKEINPNIFLESCLEDKVKGGLELISSRGGDIENPLHINFKFENEEYSNISYLCYTQNYYIPCTNQKPLLIQHLKNEIENYISEDVEKCFNDLTASLEKEKYEVESSYKNFNASLLEDKIYINIYGEIISSKGEETEKKENFKIVIPTKFYNLAIVAQEIASQEARFCNFEYLGYMLLYPEFYIDKFRTSDSTIIYTLKDEKTDERFRFAVRSCVIPPGF